MSGGGDDGGFVTGDDAAVSAFSVCIEMLVSVKPLDILRGPCYNFQPGFDDHKTCVFNEISGHLQLCLSQTEKGI